MSDGVLDLMQRRLNYLRKLKEDLDRDPEMIQLVMEMLNDVQPTAFEKIKRVIGDKAMTIGDIMNSTGLERGAISNVLYKTHKDTFSSRHQEGNRNVLWTIQKDKPVKEAAKVAEVAAI